MTKQDLIESVFQNKQRPLELYGVINEYIKKLEGVNVTVTKSQVSFGTKRKFAWVWLPERWVKNNPKDSVVLTFGLSYQVKNPKIKEAVEPVPGRWTHHMIISTSSDFDEDVRRWVNEAWRNSRT